jgi:MoaA/NifB/PqqE/SkfB family radical SAM enzyme
MIEEIARFFYYSLIKIDNLFKLNIDEKFGRTFFSILRNIRYESFSSKPKFVKIENTNFCNSKCLYCPHRIMKRKKGFMSDKLFKKIVEECIEWKIKEIHLCNFGEPLIDKKLYKKIRYIKKRSRIKTVIFTNGRLLTKQVSKKLMTSGLDELWISFDGFSKEHFEKYRYPLKYDEVLKNIIDAINVKKRLNAKTKIILQTVFDFKNMNIKDLKNFKKNGIKKSIESVYKSFMIGMVILKEMKSPQTTFFVQTYFSI